jgi:hypothetical protein
MTPSETRSKEASTRQPRCGREEGQEEKGSDIINHASQNEKSKANKGTDGLLSLKVKENTQKSPVLEGILTRSHNGRC